MSVFRWAKFRSTKSGIKIHTQIDIATEIPVFYRISHANMHDIKSMDWFIYERNACYVFDRGYFDLSLLYAIEQAGAFFIIREKFRPDYEIIEGEDMLEGQDNVLRDQTIRFTGKRNSGNYPVPLRRIVFYAADLGRVFTFYTKNFYLKAKEIALLYRYRWQVELFFKWIKQHLRVKSFWGQSENAVRIQIHVAIITYCLVAIIEHDLKLDRPVFEVMRILGNSLLVKDPIQELLVPMANSVDDDDESQLQLDFKFY
jgi:transposase